MLSSCRALAGHYEPQKWSWQRKPARLFVEEFHTPGHIFLCIENTSGLKVWNGHTKLLVVLAKFVGITPILVCQDPFYKTSSIPKLLSLHIPLFDITKMLFSYFMGLLTVFTNFNFFLNWIWQMGSFHNEVGWAFSHSTRTYNLI
jgi:hypothetical protein